MSEQQQKLKKNDNRSSVRRFFVVMVICGTVIIVLQFVGQMTSTSLAPEVIPTAEMLLDTPFGIALPNGEGSIVLDVWENRSGNIDTICIELQIDEQSLQMYKNNSQLFVDEGWVFLASWIYYEDTELNA